MEKLVNCIRNPDFNPSLYGGYLLGNLQFARTFPYSAGALEEAFLKANFFLTQNGYTGFSFEEFSRDLSIWDDKVRLFENPHPSKSNGRQRNELLLVIDIFNENNPIDVIIFCLKRIIKERDLSRLYNSKVLSNAISIGAQNLVDVVSLDTVSQTNADRVKNELSDVLVYAFLLAELHDIDIHRLLLGKINVGDDAFLFRQLQNRSD